MSPSTCLCTEMIPCVSLDKPVILNLSEVIKVTNRENTAYNKTVLKT